MLRPEMSLALKSGGTASVCARQETVDVRMMAVIKMDADIVFIPVFYHKIMAPG